MINKTRFRINGLMMLLAGTPLFATEIPKMDMSKLMGMGTEMYEFEDGLYPMLTAMFDNDGDGFEDAKFVYHMMPYDESRSSTFLFEYMIDWNKNNQYEDREKVRINYEETGENE